MKFARFHHKSNNAQQKAANFNNSSHDKRNKSNVQKLKYLNSGLTPCADINFKISNREDTRSIVISFVKCYQ